MEKDNQNLAIADLHETVSLLGEMNSTLRRIEARHAETSDAHQAQLRAIRSETKHVGMMAAWCGLAALFFVIPQVIAWFKS